MRLISIDPSINRMGVAFFEDGQLRQVETIRTRRRGCAGHDDRVEHLLAEVDDRLTRWKPDLVAIESCGS